MAVIQKMQEATIRPWMGIYLRILAVIVALGGWVHLANILGLSGRPWLETPLTFQILDVVLLVLDLTMAIGLWKRKAWSVILLLVVLFVFQFIPYTLFLDYFARTVEDRQTILGLLGTETLLVAIMAALYHFKK